MLLALVFRFSNHFMEMIATRNLMQISFVLSREPVIPYGQVDFVALNMRRNHICPRQRAFDLLIGLMEISIADQEIHYTKFRSISSYSVLSHSLHSDWLRAGKFIVNL